jgi:hypothetical protein
MISSDLCNRIGKISSDKIKQQAPMSAAEAQAVVAIDLL